MFLWFHWINYWIEIDHLFENLTNSYSSAGASKLLRNSNAYSSTKTMFGWNINFALPKIYQSINLSIYFQCFICFIIFDLCTWSKLIFYFLWPIVLSSFSFSSPLVLSALFYLIFFLMSFALFHKHLVHWEHSCWQISRLSLITSGK